MIVDCLLKIEYLWMSLRSVNLFFIRAQVHRSIRQKSIGYNPKSSLINTTLTLFSGKDFSVIVQVLQIRSGLLHS